MLKVFVAFNRIQKVPRLFSKREKISEYFIPLSRRNHQSSQAESENSPPSNEEEPWRERGKKELNPSVIMDLFLEKFDDDLLYFPEILSKKEWTRLIEWGGYVEDIMGKIKYDEVLSSNKMPDSVFSDLKTLKIFKKQIPKKYGGLELTNTENCYIQELLGINPSIARMLAENEEMGIKALVKYGTEEQKEKYLPKLATGESMISFAFLEESSSVMDCKKSIGLQAKHYDDHYVLQGRKKWVYNAKHSDVFLVLGSETANVEQGIFLAHSIFIVDKDTKGVRVNPPMKKPWFKGVDVCEVVFDEVIVKEENVLGEYGKGFTLLQDIVKCNRTSTVAECSTILKKLYHDALVKSKTSMLFDKPIANYQYCEFALGELACLSYAAESVAFYLAARADYYQNPDLTLEVYMAKIFGAELIQEALQIYFNLLGKNGYLKGSFVEELIQNAPFYAVIDDTSYDLKIFVMSNIIQYLGNQVSTTIKRLAEPKNYPTEFFSFSMLMKAHEKDRANPKLDLSMCVYRGVESCAKDLEYCLSKLNYASMKQFHMFGNKVLQNDYDIIIICDILVRTYALIACTARASRAGFLSLPDCSLEVRLAVAFSTRTMTTVKSLANLLGRNEEELQTYSKIGREAIENKEYMVEHPLMRNF